MSRRLPARLMERVAFDSSGCWLWTGHIDRSGYGKYSPRHAQAGVLAHRYVYELLVGPIPEGMTLDHVRARGCVHTHCVNPDHLEAVPFVENMQRRYETQTHCKHGHEFTEANTHIRKTGHRQCRACVARRSAEYRKRQTEEPR